MNKKIFYLLTLFAFVYGICTQPVMGQASADSTANAASQKEDPLAAFRGKNGRFALTKAAPSLTVVSDYTGPIGNRSTFFGDVLGMRQELLEKGVTIDFRLTQVVQGIASGGPQDNPGVKSNGLLDYGLSFDTGKLGWWGGGLIVFNAETRYGNNLVGSTGTLSPVNYGALWPGSERNSFLMDYYLMQQLPKNITMMVGRLNAVEFLDRNKFANSPRNQFLNGALSNDLLMGSFISFSTYGLLFHFQISKHFGLNLAAADAAIQPGDWTGKDSGGFFSAVNTAVDWEIAWNVDNGLGGDIDFTWLWANNNPTDINNPRLPLDILEGNPLPTVTSNNLLGFNVQQYLWKPGGNRDPKNRKPVRSAQYDFQEPGIGLHYRFGWTPEDRNPYNVYMSGGIGGRGFLAKRPYDRFGVGIYWLKESNDLDRVLEELEGQLLKDEVGFEMFYNLAITPWVGFTIDLQWINSGVRATDKNTLIWGSRLDFTL